MDGFLYDAHIVFTLVSGSKVLKGFNVLPNLQGPLAVTGLKGRKHLKRELRCNIDQSGSKSSGARRKQERSPAFGCTADPGDFYVSGRISGQVAKALQIVDRVFHGNYFWVAGQFIK